MIQRFEAEKYRITLCFASHIGFDKTENQDAIHFAANGNAFALSICDGLGSAPLSALGSEKAAKLMVEHLLSGSFDKNEFKEAWVKTFPDNTQLFNTTAKFILIQNKSIRLGGVGDGLIAIQNKDGIVSQTNHGDFSNQTSCIFDIKYDENFVDETKKLTIPSVIMIATDGFSEDIKEDGLEVLMKAAVDSLSNEEACQEFDASLLELLQHWPNKTNGDDKTVAFILVEERA